MKNEYGKVTSIAEVFDLNSESFGPTKGRNNTQIGLGSGIAMLLGLCKYDGYKITTEEHSFLILIANETECSETWRYFTSEDDTDDFVGKTLMEVTLTDTALNKQALANSGYYEDNGGIQFVDFKFTDGSVLQFAVYNAHNGYYGHPIIVAIDDDAILKDVL